MKLDLDFSLYKGATRLKDWWKAVKEHSTKIQSAHNALEDTVATSCTQLNERINNENMLRIAAHNELLKSIDAEIAKREEQDTELRQMINSEVSERENGESSLAGDLENETSVRTESYNELQGKITIETTNRTNADTALSNRVTAVENTSHTHSNKSVLDGITSSNIAAWNNNTRGSYWYRGTAMSGTSTTTGAYSYSACPQVKVDDMYLNTSNGNIYACTTAGNGTAAKWTYQGCIKSATGSTGGTSQDKQAVYSTAPTQIGTWIDGKAIYRVAWSFTIAEYKAAGVIYGINDLPHYPSSISGKGVVREHYNIAAWSIPEGFSYTNVPDLQSGISANSSIPTTTVVYCVLEYIAS